VIGHGEGGADLAEHVVSEIRAWDATGGNDAPRTGLPDGRRRLA
jgi:protein-L-isoaspartate(D-aspartate) O-methyltransferase